VAWELTESAGVTTGPLETVTSQPTRCLEHVAALPHWQCETLSTARRESCHT